MALELRPLVPADAAAMHALRLRGLRETPEAFGSTYAEEAAFTVEFVAQRLAPPAGGARKVTLGAFEDGLLVGLVVCMQLARPKTRHTAEVAAMYVAPEARRRGVGRALLDRVVAEARTWDGVDRLTLTVVERCAASRRLYRACGFAAFGLEPDALREGGRSDAVEHMVLRLLA